MGPRIFDSVPCDSYLTKVWIISVWCPVLMCHSAAVSLTSSCKNTWLGQHVFMGLHTL